MYPELWSKVSSANTVDNPIIVTDSDWLSSKTTDGTVGKYSSGDGSTTFRVPLLRKVYLGARDVEDTPSIGEFLEDQMRPITAGWSSNNSFIRPVETNAIPTGAFVTDNNTRALGGTQTGNGRGIYGINSALLGSNYNGVFTRGRTIVYYPMLKAFYANRIVISNITVPAATDNVPLFTPLVRLFNTPSPGCLFCTIDNGVLNGDAYPDAYQELVNLQSDSNIVTMDEYIIDMTTNGGITGKFALDTTANTFRIPCMPGQ